MRNPLKAEQSGGWGKRYRNHHQLGGAASRRGRFVSTCVLKSVPSPGQGLQEKPDSKGSVQKCADPPGPGLVLAPTPQEKSSLLIKVFLSCWLRLLGQCSSFTIFTLHI